MSAAIHMCMHLVLIASIGTSNRLVESIVNAVVTSDAGAFVVDSYFRLFPEQLGDQLGNILFTHDADSDPWFHEGTGISEIGRQIINTLTSDQGFHACFCRASVARTSRSYKVRVCFHGDPEKLPEITAHGANSFLNRTFNQCATLGTKRTLLKLRQEWGQKCRRYWGYTSSLGIHQREQPFSANCDRMYFYFGVALGSKCTSRIGAVFCQFVRTP